MSAFRTIANWLCLTFSMTVELRQSYPNALLNLAGTNLALQRTHERIGNCKVVRG